MRIIFRKNIDIDKWDRLVSGEKELAVFSHSEYLDATAKNWCVLVVGDYEGGIAIPYLDQLKFKIVYTPIFVRYLQWLGTNKPDKTKLLNSLTKHFKAGILNLKWDDSSDDKSLFYQHISPLEDVIFKNQAKRMIKKFDQSDLILMRSESKTEVMKIIRNELPKKIRTLSHETLDKLSSLVNNLQVSNKLEIITVKNDCYTLGGIFLVRSNDTLLYLKGTFTKQAKDMGAMYKTMSIAIEQAKLEGLTFDFGGSRVDGVARFNHNLGGKDVYYEIMEWNHAPVWFNLLKKGKEFIRKK